MVPRSSRGGRGGEERIMYVRTARRECINKNDSTILVTITEEKENKNHTSKIEEFIMEKG
jgi:hypothetical protein